MSSFSKETSSQTFNLHSKKSNNPLGQSPKPHQLIISPTSTIRHSSTLIDSTDEDPSTPRFSAHSDDYFNQSDLIHSSSETHPINSPSSINQSIQDEPFHPITIHSPDPLPLPTHFVSGASRRLPELQQQLHLNPESIPELNPPTELDPLLSFTSDRLHPPSLQSQSQLHPHLPLHNPHSHPLSSPSPLHHPSRQPNPKSHRKIGTFDGVYLPTILSIFNVIYFLRFGYCIGQIGLLATISLLLLAYAINTLTVFSLSAIATNGQVRGGGAYYLISRTLGPEFGGSIGILFCLSQALTAAMNIIGFVESLIEVTHDYLHPQSPLPLTDSFEQLSSPTPTIRYFIKSLALLFATISCITLGRTTVFTSMARSMATILLLTLISILFSFLQKTPFQDPIEHFTYTGFSFQTFQENLYPSHLTKLTNPPSSFISPRFSDYQTVFGVLFPSVSGILAGSSLSGELRKPSKSLPQGMLWALVCVIIIYVLSLLGFSLSCGRDGLIFLNERGGLNLMIYKVSEYKPLIGIGVLLGSIFSSIMGITVCGKILQAISRDGLIPILKPFFSQGSQIGDDPIYSILFCYLFCQLALLYNINKIAIHITTISLLIFACINLACFTLRVSGSPNFRPSFRLFSEWTALLGLLLAFVSMYAVDPVSASTSLIVMMVLFVVIHYSSPAKQWGEVTQSIIYHQVRKYLLRLDERKDNVKYWRPQVLLFTNDPRHDWNQIVFCNSLKKGGLYVLAHIIKSEFSSESIRELQEQQLNWLSLVDISNIKAFVDITLAPDERVGARHLLLTSGLGGMRPNICMLGFPTNLKWRRRGKLFNGEDETVSNGANERRQKRMKRRSDSSLTVKGLIIDSVSEVKIDCLGSLPTDSQRSETPIKPIDFVGIIEDSLSLNKSVGLTYGFEKLRLPSSISKPQSNEGHRLHISTSLGGLASASFGGLGGNANGNGKVEEEVKGRKRWIDLWPILRDGESGWETYTMVLQLGMILSMVPSWRSQHTLRVTIFCELEEEIEEERRRMEKLLNDLRIRACLRVCVLGNGEIQSYECLVKGKEVDVVTWSTLENALGGDPWWETLKFMRAQDGPHVGTSTHPNQTSTTRESSETSSTRSEDPKRKSVDRSLLTKHSQTNNIRIKALHPFSRRPSTQDQRASKNEREGHGGNKKEAEEEEEEEELMLEENDGDDDTIARAAYKKRNSKPPMKDSHHRSDAGGDGHMNFEGLPDEPFTPRLQSVHQQEPSTSSHQPTTTFDHHSLNLQNLSLLSPKDFNLNLQSDFSNLSKKSNSKSNASVNKTPASFKKIINRNRIKFNKPMMKRISSIDLNPTNLNVDSHHSNPHHHNPVVELDFNSLPMRAQLVCLNELMKLHSNSGSDLEEEEEGKEETALIFTSLPPPDLGSSNSYENSSKYLNEIESFLDGLPPVLAIYAKQLTVTASL